MELPGSQEYIQIQDALEILAIIDPAKYNEMQGSTIDYQISYGNLNPNGGQVNADGSTTRLDGQTNIVKTTLDGLDVRDIKTDASGEVTGATIIRSRTLDEQEELRNAGKGEEIEKDGNKVVATENEADARIENPKVVGIILDNSMKSVDGKKRARVLAHETFGHAHYGTLVNKTKA